VRVSAQRWQAAQRAELANWQHTLRTPRNIVAEVADSVGLDGFIESVAPLRRLVRGGGAAMLEVGIGPLGLGWLGLFGQSDPRRAWALDPLPLLALDPLPDKELAEFIARKRRAYTFVQTAAEQADFSPGQFQLIVCDNVLDHAQEPLEILVKCREWLSQDGFLVLGVNTFSLARLAKWRVLAALHPDDGRFAMHPHAGTHGMWRRMVCRAGFCILKERGPAPLEALVAKATRSYFACQKQR